MAGMMTQVFYRAQMFPRFLNKNFANRLLLDVNLSDSSGFAFLDDLKKQNFQIPVIFLTASTSEVHTVKGLDMGGDDYITKPFSFPELIARISAVLKRAETSQDYHIPKNAKLNQESFDFCEATGRHFIHAVWRIYVDVRGRSLDQYIVKIRDIFRSHGVGNIYDPENSSQ